MVLVEEDPPRGGLFELEQTTYHRVVDTRTQEIVLTFRGEMEASFERDNRFLGRLLLVRRARGGGCPG